MTVTYKNTRFDPDLVEFHSIAKEEITVEKVSHLGSWRESTMYSDSKQAALAYCDALTSYDHVNTPSYHTALAAHFDEKAIAEIAALVIHMNLWTRLKLAQGQVSLAE